MMQLRAAQRLIHHVVSCTGAGAAVASAETVHRLLEQVKATTRRNSILLAIPEITNQPSVAAVERAVCHSMQLGMTILFHWIWAATLNVSCMAQHECDLVLEKL